jgi:hypothetical protein
MAKKANPFKKGGFEKSKFDKDKGFKEGSKKDLAADKKQRQQYKKGK